VGVTSLVVDGSPDGCRAAARELRLLEARASATAEHLAAAHSAAAGGWHGPAGEGFRRQVKATLVLADDQADRLRLVGPALEVLATRLDGVRAMMHEARAIARAGGLPLGGDALPHSRDVPPGQADALARATAVVVRARDREARAQADWLAVLDDAFPPLDLGRLDHPLPEPVRDRVPPWPGLAGARRVLEYELPVGLPMLPPALRTPFLGWTGVVQPMFRAAAEQVADDRDRDDLGLLERWARGTLVASATGVGAVGGIVLCTRFAATRKAAPVCGRAGAWAGRQASRKALEVADAH
jgi:hypothetical protein